MEIKTKVTGSVVMSDELAVYITNKLEKITIFLKKDPTAIFEVEVGTTAGGQRTGDVYRAEIHATFAGGDVYAESTAANLHLAIDRTIKEARREFKKRRGKNNDAMRKGAIQVKDFFRNFGK